MKDIKKSIRRYLSSRLGAPAVELCDSELNAMEVALESGASRYWTAFPHQTISTLYVSSSCGQAKHNIDTLKSTAFTNPGILDSVYFLGVGRYDLTTNASYHQSGSSHFDRKLLGRSTGGNPNLPTEDPRYLADRVLLNSSEEDFLFGELDYRHDIVNNEIVFITPNIEGTATLWYNWGFCCEKTLELLPMVHFEVFKKIVALEFLEITLAGRSSVTLNGDFSLDITDITSKRDALKEELKEEIANMSISVGVWG